MFAIGRHGGGPMKRFRAIVLIARVLYWFSGFVFLAGLVGFFFTTQGSKGLVIAGIGIGMWVAARLLAGVAAVLFERLDEEDQDAIDPYGELRGGGTGWGV